MCDIVLAIVGNRLFVRSSGGIIEELFVDLSVVFFFFLVTNI